MFYVEKTHTQQEQSEILGEVIEGLGFYIKDHQQEAGELLQNYSISTDGSYKQMTDAYVEKLFGNDKKFYQDLLTALSKHNLIDIEIFADKQWSNQSGNIPWAAIIPAAGILIGGIFGTIKSGKDANAQKDEIKTRLYEMLYGIKKEEKQEQNKKNTAVTITAIIIIVISIFILFYLLFIKKKPISD